MRLSRFPLGAACPPKIQNSRPAKPAIKIGHRFEFAIYCRVGPHILLLVTGLLLQKDTAVIAYRIINGTERDTIIKFDCAILPESVRSTFVLAGLFFLEKAEVRESFFFVVISPINRY